MSVVGCGLSSRWTTRMNSRAAAKATTASRFAKTPTATAGPTSSPYSPKASTSQPQWPSPAAASFSRTRRTFISSRTPMATTRPTFAKCSSPDGVSVTRTLARAICATVLTTGFTVRSATRDSTARSTARSKTSAWAYSASDQTAPTLSFCTSSTTTPGEWASTLPVMSLAPPPTTTRRFSGVFRRPCIAATKR